MSKAAASISNRKSSSSAAAMRGKDLLTFVLHPKQLVTLRSKATEILYGGANRGKRPLQYAGRGGRGPTKVLPGCNRVVAGFGHFERLFCRVFFGTPAAP